jgi:hypothetical protein
MEDVPLDVKASELSLKGIQGIVGFEFNLSWD